jgi:DNA helicase-4
MQVVKNIEECQIANFLIVNNMSYEYDYPYEVETVTDSYPQYKPQFTIRQGDQSVSVPSFGSLKLDFIYNFNCQT